MAITYFLIVIFVLLEFIVCQNCPSMYKRLSTEHSYCKPRNPRCKIISAGIQSQAEISKILEIHNSYRSRIATGRETQDGGLPSAADMMQMVWDQELSDVSQKWAEQCNYTHDCRSCRAVPSYAVGQNIAFKEWTCPSGNCLNQERRHKRDWEGVIKLYYDEVKYFHKNQISPYPFEERFGHFTQVIWAKTWRVGCGYVSYQNGRNYRQYYTCNYGPAGNTLSKSVYSAGKPCTRCPVNSCCGKHCSAPNYEGLCQLLPHNAAPIYPIDKEGLLLYCDFGKQTKRDCEMDSTEKNRWMIKETHSGNILNTVLHGGETSTLHFHKMVNPNSNFCMVLKYSKGPNEAGQKDSSKISLLFETQKYLPNTITITTSSSEVMTYSLDLRWKARTKFSLTFSVPTGSPPQYLNLESILIREGKCKNEK